MKIKFLLFILLFSLYSESTAGGSSRVVKKEEFIKKIEPLGLIFRMPENFVETTVSENKDLWYGFAIKYLKGDFEIRFSYWSLIPDVIAYKKCKLDSTCTMVSPNAIYKGRIQSNVMNMTKGKLWPIDPFSTADVRKEFNADAGGSSFFEFNCEFGKGYKFGQMIYLHKDNLADVIITYMSNNRELHSDLMGKAFYSLLFK